MAIIYIKLLLAAIISLVLTIKSIRVLPNIYSIRFVSGYYTFQICIYLLFIILLPDAKVLGCSYNLKIIDGVDAFLMAWIIFQFGIFIAAYVSSLFMVKLKNQPSLINLIQSSSPRIEGPLYFFALIFFLYPFLAFASDGFFSYIIRVIFNNFQFVPFVAGVYFMRNRSLRNVWLISLLSLLILGTFSGSRGIAVFPILFYCFGILYSNISYRLKKIFVINVLIFLIPTISFFSFIGQVRHIIGRIPLNEVSFERMVKMYEIYTLYALREKRESDKAEDLNQGPGRLLNHPNAAVPMVIPKRKPFRYYDGIVDVDLKYTLNIEFLTGIGKKEYYSKGYSTGILNKYGYYVRPGVSWEFSIMSEGWSRFGKIGVFVYSLTWGLFLIVFEFAIIFFNIRNPIFRIFFTILICWVALQSYAEPLFFNCRSLILNFILAWVLLMIFKIKLLRYE